MGIVEAGSINEDRATSVDNKFIGDLDFGGARPQVHSNAKMGTARQVDELTIVNQFVDRPNVCGSHGSLSASCRAHDTGGHQPGYW